MRATTPAPSVATAGRATSGAGADTVGSSPQPDTAATAISRTAARRPLTDPG